VFLQHNLRVAVVLLRCFFGCGFFGLFDVVGGFVGDDAQDAFCYRLAFVRVPSAVSLWGMMKNLPCSFYAQRRRVCYHIRLSPDSAPYQHASKLLLRLRDACIIQNTISQD